MRRRRPAPQAPTAALEAERWRELTTTILAGTERLLAGARLETP
jgi:hypothetical protein